MEIYRVTKDSPEWLFKAYDYARTDAFVFGQSIGMEREFGHDGPRDDANIIVITDGGKPLAGCNITYPKDGIARIGRVCVIREKQKSGVGHILIEEAERWIKENGVSHIVITAQDRAAGFYKRCGYVDSDKDPSEFEPGRKPMTAEEKAEKLRTSGFICVVVEKWLQ